MTSLEFAGGAPSTADRRDSRFEIRDSLIRCYHTPVRKVIARVDEEHGCPLYHKGDTVEFSYPAVEGVDFAPVCMRAVIAFAGNIAAVRNGDSPLNHQHVYCGGCDQGKAWFHFGVEAAMTTFRVAPQFATFALNALGKMKLFSGARVSLLERVLPLLRERRVLDGEVVITRGQPGRALFIIVIGQFAVFSVDDHGVEHQLATLSIGDCFGEMSLITGEAASATVRAAGPGVLLEVTKEDFPRLLSVVPTMGMTLARILANRLARSSTHVLEEIKRGIIGRLDMISAAEIIQAMNVANQTGVLSVQGENRSAQVYFNEGQVADVRAGDKTGEDAFYDLIGWKRGTFRFHPGPKDIKRTIQCDTIGLLLEGMRRMDETRETQRIQAQGPLPSLLDPPAPAPPPEPQEAAPPPPGA